MTQKEIKALEEKVAAAKAEAAEKVAATVKVTRLQAQLKVMTDDKLITAKAHQAITAATSDKLREIEIACESIVSEMPIYSAKTRENRKWNPSRQYGMGNQIAALTGILSGIQYSAMDHRVQMLAYTGLNEDLIEATLEAFGNTAYYSKNHDIVINEVPYSLEGIQNALMLIEEVLDVSLDKSKVTSNVLRSKFEVARLKATADAEEAHVTQELSNQVITL